MVAVEKLLHRRTDLSAFLVHLTRERDGVEPRDRLLMIAEDCVLRAGSPFGMAAKYEPLLAGTPASQKAVCFTETPLEHTWMLIQDIDYRSVRLAPYGLVFTRTTARRMHCNPVWYLDISTRGGRNWLTVPVNELVETAVEASKDGVGQVDPAVLQAQPVLRLTPFVEQMGPTRDGGRKEFWWEREWRHQGDLIFRPRHVVAFLVPEADHEAFREELVTRNPKWERRPRPLLDPTWGLETMIATLAGMDPEDTGPFPVV